MRGFGASEVRVYVPHTIYINVIASCAGIFVDLTSHRRDDNIQLCYIHIVSVWRGEEAGYQIRAHSAAFLSSHCRLIIYKTRARPKPKPNRKATSARGNIISVDVKYYYGAIGVSYRIVYC